METKKTTVVVVGAGPAGLATSACLNVKNIPHIILEREDCYASLWRKRAYGRLKLHLAKEFCELPHMSYPPNSPTFIPKNGFIKYLDDYVSHFSIHPIFNTQVTYAAFDHDNKSWVVEAENSQSVVKQRWAAEFLVVATGENSEGFIPPFPGLNSFGGDVIHSNKYSDGEKFRDRDVLVVGSGNSGMEIALDLYNWGANTSVVIRTPVHVLDETMVRIAMTLMLYVPLYLADAVALLLSKWKYGNLSDYGIERPTTGGPFYLKRTTGRSPVIDVGTIRKIRENKIKVFPAVERVDKDSVYFTNGKKLECDTIVLATGYRSTVKKWLKDEGWLFGENGMPEKSLAHHWKGQNGLYCVGFAQNGLFGINKDATAAVADITAVLRRKN
ncbi:hypothetical protein ACS0TY_028139 [Phlomoides rotata]